jgi:hypothetical protein
MKEQRSGTQYMMDYGGREGTDYAGKIIPEVLASRDEWK